MNTRSRLATTVHSGAMGPKLPPYAAEAGSTPRRVARLARTARRWVYAAAPVVLLAVTVTYAATDPKIPAAAGD